MLCPRSCNPDGFANYSGMQNQFPDILAVIQVALEGVISASSAQAALAAGQLPQGDMLPWMIGQQFQDSRFPSLSGARIVRIATHPSVVGAGYGSKAIRELCKYYQGDFFGELLQGTRPTCLCSLV
jgi:N-acetyltransferase 10